jgi:hypothetical protein
VIHTPKRDAQGQAAHIFSGTYFFRDQSIALRRRAKAMCMDMTAEPG